MKRTLCHSVRWFLPGGGLLLALLGGWLPLPLPVLLLLFAAAAVAAMAGLWPGDCFLSGWRRVCLPFLWLLPGFLAGQPFFAALATVFYAVGHLAFERVTAKAAEPDKSTGHLLRRLGRRTILAAVVWGVISLLPVLLCLVGVLAWQDGLARTAVMLALFPAGLGGVVLTLHLHTAQSNAAKAGAVLRSPAVAEQLANMDSLALDKQDTLILSPLTVVSLNTLPDVQADLCVGLAALLEEGVDHPVANALLAHAERVDVTAGEGAVLADKAVLPSMGVVATLHGRRVMCGNLHLLEQYGLVAENLPEGTVYLAIDNKVVASFELVGPLREDAPAAIAAVRKLGIAPPVLLTGDRPTAAEKAAVQVGIERVYAAMTTEGKLSMVREMQRRYAGVAVIANSPQELPLLRQADIAITFDTASSAVQEQADIVLQRMEALPAAMTAGRQQMTHWRRKITLSLIISGLAGLLGLLGWLPLWGAGGVKMLCLLAASAGFRKD